MTNFFGTNNVSTRNDSSNRTILDVILTNNYEETTDKIFIGGNPLSLVKIGNYYGLKIIRININSNLYDTTAIYGNPFSVYHLNSIQLMPISVYTENDYPTGYTVFNGIPLALNENNKLILSNIDINDINSLDEIKTTSIGGNPISIGIIGSNWYLLTVFIT